ncbi:hypothetical protein GCM10010174_91390 [Kutzneria viridogrisea]|uniref:Secreted protein n=2 Tax=Kutzneria TaxID=43356 RepID=W5VZU6_9PSEU|nr:hypothetical protein [Kutzneria albida]AHH93806.1 hypothetical protein KALB_429 [Kutzneria albida DSM 43870]MBA8931189.1 copper(I)-binding protein [Kutzneria viridogrisea]
MNSKLRLLPAVLGVSAAVLLTGCGAGQITQTSTQVAGVNGANGTVGTLAVRDAQLAFPVNANRYYSRGDNAPLIITIANSGELGDELKAVTSPQFASATISGTTAIAARNSVVAGKDLDDNPAPTATTVPSSSAATPTSASGSPSATTTTGTSTTGASATGSSAPTTKLPVGKIRIVLTGLKLDKLTPGQTVDVRFTFAVSGELTLRLPIGASADPRPEGKEG